MQLQPGEFYISDGFTVRRVEDYGPAPDGQPYAFELRVYTAAGHMDGTLFTRALLTESMLASVMAHLSRRGETGDTHGEALAFLQAGQPTYIIVNGVRHLFAESSIDYTRILTMAGEDPHAVRSVTFQHGQTAGTVAPNQWVTVREGMRFNVYDTSAA